MAAHVIVVVDDDPDFCELIQDLLTDEGYQMVLCASTDEAPTTIRRQRPALVMLDVHVERHGVGWLLLEQLRQKPATAVIPVLVCSADTPLLRRQADQLHAQGIGVLPKPFDLDDLLTQVRALIGLPPTPRAPRRR